MWYSHRLPEDPQMPSGEPPRTFPPRHHPCIPRQGLPRGEWLKEMSPTNTPVTSLQSQLTFESQLKTVFPSSFWYFLTLTLQITWIYIWDSQTTQPHLWWNPISPILSRPYKALSGIRKNATTSSNAIVMESITGSSSARSHSLLAQTDWCTSSLALNSRLSSISSLCNCLCSTEGQNEVFGHDLITLILLYNFINFCCSKPPLWVKYCISSTSGFVVSAKSLNLFGIYFPIMSKDRIGLNL